MPAGRHGRTSSMVIRSSFGLRTRGSSGLAGRPANIQKLIKEEQVKEINKIAPKFIAAYETRVANWSEKTKPKFVKVVTPRGPDQPLSMFIQTRGTEHQKLTFAMLDSKGRKAGRIYSPKRKMKFRKNYFGKTAPGDVYGRGRRRTGPTTFAWFVDHPGIEPRGFSDAIEEELKPEFRRVIKNGTRAAMYRIGAK